jgi:hypothetical protein
VWLKLKIETKMSKGKYVSKIKTVILKGILFKLNPKTDNDKKINCNNKFMFVINNPKGAHL